MEIVIRHLSHNATHLNRDCSLKAMTYIMYFVKQSGNYKEELSVFTVSTKNREYIHFKVSLVLG